MLLTEPRTRPIPFVDPLRSVAPGHQVIAAPVCPAPAWQPHRRTEPLVRSEPKSRTASARYDGAYSLNVRSCTTGQVYRFTHPGAVLNIHAADISMLKRIEQLTVLV